MKTIEQAATNAYSIEVLSSGCNAGVSFGKEMFKHGVEFSQQWIPVEIEMPTNENGYIDRIVLIKSKNGQVIETAKYSSTQNRWLYSSIASRNPSYWRPIDFL